MKEITLVDVWCLELGNKKAKVWTLALWAY